MEGPLHTLRESEYPHEDTEAVERINAAIMITAVSQVLEPENKEEVVGYYRDLMSRIQSLLRGYDFDGNPLPVRKEGDAKDAD